MRRKTKHNRFQRMISLFLAFILVLELGNGIAAVYAAGDEETGPQETPAAISAEEIAQAKQKAEEEAINEVNQALADAGVQKLPSLEEYYGDNAPKIITLTEFIAAVGEYNTFNAELASNYQDYCIRIDNAAELYRWSVNCNSDIEGSKEKEFYLSAHFVLGNHIEYNSGSFNYGGGVCYYLPVGTAEQPFNGIFDGQGFEIRGLSFDVSQKGKAKNITSYGLFGTIGESGTVKNVGLVGTAEMKTEGQVAVATQLGMLAVYNQGHIEKAYCDLTGQNGTSAVASSDFGGIVYSNSGTIENVYFAGNDFTSEKGEQKSDPVCCVNTGSVLNAYYDSDVYAMPITGVSQTSAEGEAVSDVQVVGMTTVQLKTLGQNDEADSVEFANNTEDEYHWHIVRKYLRTSTVNRNTLIKEADNHFEYPKLYGLTSDLKVYYWSYDVGTGTEFTVSTPADLVYFPHAPEYFAENAVTEGNRLFHFTFRMNRNIDMSWVADDAYVPNSNNFRSYFTAEAPAGVQGAYNGNYSIINLRIRVPAVNYGADGSNTYYYGLIGRARTTDIADDEVEGQKHGAISNVNFIGGGIDTGSYDFTRGYKSGNTQLYMGMACGNLYDSGSVVNLHSSADVIYADGTVSVRACIGGLIGGTYTCERMENMTNTGNVYGGTHPYTEGYNGNSSCIGGLVGYGVFRRDTVTQKDMEHYRMRNLVNYGTVTGIGVYGSMETPQERRQTDTDNVGRAQNYYVGGAFGSNSNNAGNGVCLDMVVNFGDIYDVPCKEETVSIYDEQGSETGKATRMSGIVPEGQYILNYQSYIGGVSGSRLVAGDAFDAYQYNRDTGEFGQQVLLDRAYNFGDITVSESRWGWVGGVRAFDSGLAVNRKNFGDITAYSLQNSCSGIGGGDINEAGATYDSINYGSLYMDNSSRSGRQTQWSKFDCKMHLCGIGWCLAYRCENYGNLTMSYAGYVGCARNAGSNKTSATFDQDILGVGYSAGECRNSGNIYATTFDRWTGKYVYMDLTAEDFLDSAVYGEDFYGQDYRHAVMARSMRFLFVSGVARNDAVHCVNAGDITIAGTPDEYDELIQTYEELVEKLGYSPNEVCRETGLGGANGWNDGTDGTGLNSDKRVLIYQRIWRNCYVAGCSASSENNGYTADTCVNLGNITVKDDFSWKVGAAGVIVKGSAMDCVNKGNVTVDSDGCTGEDTPLHAGGIITVANTVSNCLNTGAVSANDTDGNVYAAGIACLPLNIEWNIDDCVNLGGVTIQRKGERQQRGGQSTYAGGISSYVDIGFAGRISGCGNYGEVSVNIDSKRYVSDNKDTTKDTVYLELNGVKPDDSVLYDRSEDTVAVGGIVGNIRFNPGTGPHTVTLNACINQGAVRADCRQMYGKSMVYVGGAAGMMNYNANVKSLGGDALVLTNMVNHGNVDLHFEKEEYGSYDVRRSAGGIIGYLYACDLHEDHVDIQTRYVLEYLLNTGTVTVTAPAEDIKYQGGYKGGFVGRLYWCSARSCNTQWIFRSILSYTDEKLFGYTENLNNVYLISGENGEGLDLYQKDGNEKYAATYSNRLTMENLYSGYQGTETLTIGRNGYYDKSKDDPDRQELKAKTVTVGTLSTDSTDTEGKKYIYPTFDENGAETASAFFQTGVRDESTGAVCVLGYLPYGGLSDAYREKYAGLNGGTYSTTVPEKPGDAASEEELEKYQEWHDQLGGFVLISARPGTNGADYLPNQFLPERVDPLNQGIGLWYDDTTGHRLVYDCAQVELLDLNDLLKVYLSSGADTTIACRREIDADGNKILYVYVPEYMAEKETEFTVSSWQVSSLATAEFYDSEHNPIEEFTGYRFMLEKSVDGSTGETVYSKTLYADVTAQNRETAQWTIQIISEKAEETLSVESAQITSSARADSYSTNRQYYDVSEESRQTKNFWDYPAYKQGPVIELKLNTKNIPDGYDLYENMTAWYYVQNAYGVTEEGMTDQTVINSTYLADLLAGNGGDYYQDEKGDIYRKTSGDTDAVLIAELLYKGKDYEMVLDEGKFTAKAERYSCVKGESTEELYYLENEGMNIRWEFVRNDDGMGIKLSSPNEDTFFTENSSAFRRTQVVSRFKWNQLNRVAADEEADAFGDLWGHYTLYSANAPYADNPLPGGYYALEFALPGGAKDTIYLAYARSDETRLNGYATFGQTQLGSTVPDGVNMAQQWKDKDTANAAGSETVRQQLYDGYGAYATYEEAVSAIENAVKDGQEIPYAARKTYSSYLNGNDPIFAQFSKAEYEYYAGCADNSLLWLSYTAGTDTMLKRLAKNIGSQYRGALIRPSIYEVHCRENGSVSSMDVIVQTVSEDMGVTRYYLMQLTFPDEPIEVSPKGNLYRSGSNPYEDAVIAKMTIQGEDYTVLEVPKGVSEQVDMCVSYTTEAMDYPVSEYNFSSASARQANEDSYFVIEYCSEDKSDFRSLGEARWIMSKGYYLSDPDTADVTVTRMDNDSFTMSLSAGAEMGYYKITPVYGRHEYFYLHSDAEEFVKTMNTGVDSSYQSKIEEIESDKGYPIYKVTMYMAYEPTVIHKRGNDDSYLKNIFMTDESGTTNLASVDADVTWDGELLKKMLELDQSTETAGQHESVEGKTNVVRYSDGRISYNADPLEDENGDSTETVHAFTAYAYISTNQRGEDGTQQPIDTVWMQMKTNPDQEQSYLPGNSTLYYLKDATFDADGDYVSGGTWVEVTFDEHGSVSEESKDYFKYKRFTVDENGQDIAKEAKLFKIVAENNNVTYYTINALQNKRNKSIEVLVGDYEYDTTQSGVVEIDKGTQKQLSDITGKYKTFSVTLQLMRDGEAVTTQTGYYQQTGNGGNNYFDLKYGSYDILLNIPESAGYTYELYYFGTGDTPVKLERSEDNPNAWRLPFRFANQISSDQTVKICVSIREKDESIWGRMKEFIFGEK